MTTFPRDAVFIGIIGSSSTKLNGIIKECVFIFINAVTFIAAKYIIEIIYMILRNCIFAKVTQIRVPNRNANQLFLSFEDLI